MSHPPMRALESWVQVAIEVALSFILPLGVSGGAGLAWLGHASGVTALIARAHRLLSPGPVSA